MTTPTPIAINGNDGAILIAQRARRSHYAEVPIGSLDEQSQLIEQVIRFAFDTLGADHLDVRVLGARQESQSPQIHLQLFRHREDPLHLRTRSAKMSEPQLRTEMKSTIWD
jgi:hypothetical protein